MHSDREFNHFLKSFKDKRGSLTPIEFKSLPFKPQRIFYVTNVPIGMERGGHAHFRTQQYLVCIKGLVKVKVHDGESWKEKIIAPNGAVHIPAMVWDKQEFLLKDTVLLVFASTNYNKHDYIEDFEEFIKLSKKNIVTCISCKGDGCKMCNKKGVLWKTRDKSKLKYYAQL